MNFGTPGSSVHGIFQARIPVVIQSLGCDSLWPDKLQHTRLPCPSLSPGDCSNSCPFSQWCYLTTSSSVSPFSSCPQSFPELGSFPESWLITSDGQSIDALALAAVLPMNIQGWFPLGLIASLVVQIVENTGVGLPFPPPGDLPDPGTEPRSPGSSALAGNSLSLSHLGSPWYIIQFSSVQFSHSVVSDPLWPHEPQHTRPPCPSPPAGVYPNPCLLSWWCHPTISSCHPLLLLPSIFPSIKVLQKKLTVLRTSLGFKW